MKTTSFEFPIVGIGASAGGLEALQAFFANVPRGGGACYVVVQHLSPDHRSIMDRLLQSCTVLDVRAIEDGEEPEPERVYVLPPSYALEFEDRAFRLLPRGDEPGLRTPIDGFFQSLARAAGRNAFCVVLSGTGSDGTKGLKAVKAAGGFAFAQSADNARFSGMPDSAIATGLVDFVLRAKDIPARLHEIIHHRASEDFDRESLTEEIEERLPEFAKLVGEHHRHDFSGYKPGTLVRRIERRMSLLRIRSVTNFLELIEDSEEEAAHLLQDLLIGVTRFFRDPDAFEALNREVVIPLVKSESESLRVWVPGCSTGEEVYSIAILFSEAMREHGLKSLQIFGTDIDEAALAHARSGVYTSAEVQAVKPALRARYFTAFNDRFEAERNLRRFCVFAPHNLAQDPPYSRIDLVSCRNLLIYLGAPLQAEIIPRLHFALEPNGTLFLGPAEGLVGEDELFHTVDSEHRIFEKDDEKPASYTPLDDLLTDASRRRRLSRGRAGLSYRPAAARHTYGSREARIERTFLKRFAQPFAVVTAGGEISYLSEAMAALVRPEGGPPSHQIEAYLTRDLRTPVQAALSGAVQSGDDVHLNGVTITDGDDTTVYDLTVSRMDSEHDAYVVILHRVRTAPAAADESSSDASNADLKAKVVELRKQLRLVAASHETTSQEIKSTNEELLSMNEELQSANQELETSREELQSITEELETVNAELALNNKKLTRANSDLRNLFDSTDVATLFLDPQLCVRSYSPGVTAFIGLRKRDIGRPLADLASTLPYPDIEADVEQVRRDLQIVEREVTIESTNATYITRLRPYRTTDDRIDGFVLTFFDITKRKRAELRLERSEQALRRQYAELETIYDTAPVGLALMDSELRWLRINENLAEINGYPAEEHIGKLQSELLPDINDEVEVLMRRVFETGEPMQGIEVRGKTAKLPTRERIWLADYVPIREDSEVVAIGCCVREVTEERELLERIASAEQKLRFVVARFPIYFVQVDASGDVVWAAGDLPGLRAASDAGESMTEFLPECVERALESEDTSGEDGVHDPLLVEVSVPGTEALRTYEVYRQPIDLATHSGGGYLAAFFAVT